MRNIHYRCFRCKITKTPKDFYYSKTHTRQSWCIQCHKDNRIHDGKTSSSKLHSRYGITREDLQQMYIDQGNKCKICGIELNPNVKTGMKNYPNIDHDHVTGRVRGLLCFTCNSGLGMFKDDINVLKLAVKYLEKDND